MLARCSRSASCACTRARAQEGDVEALVAHVEVGGCHELGRHSMLRAPSALPSKPVSGPELLVPWPGPPPPPPTPPPFLPRAFLVAPSLVLHSLSHPSPGPSPWPPPCPSPRPHPACRTLPQSLDLGFFEQQPQALFDLWRCRLAAGLARPGFQALCSACGCAVRLVALHVPCWVGQALHPV